MPRTTEFVHGDTTYVIGHVDAEVGLALGARLANMGAPIVRAARKGASIDEVLAYIISQPDLGGNLQFLAKGLAPATKVVVGGTELALGAVFNAHFAGRYDALTAWLVAAIRFDLASFLDGLSAMVDALAAELPKASDASKSPTGAPPTG